MTEQTIQGPTEAEMSAFEATFRKMQNAIIAGSELEQKFQVLQKQMDETVSTFNVEIEGLRRDLERVRNANTALDEALSISRQARDRLSEELAEAKAERNSKVQELEVFLRDSRATIERLENELENERNVSSLLRDRLSQAQGELDSSQLRVMELEEKNGWAEAKLVQASKAMDELHRALYPLQATSDAPREADNPQREGESLGEYHDRVGRYPSEREARAAAQPRTEGGQFSSEVKPDEAPSASSGW